MHIIGLTGGIASGKSTVDAELVGLQHGSGHSGIHLIPPPGNTTHVVHTSGHLGTQAPGGTGPMAQARLSVASLTNFGFDSLGAPVDASGAQLTSRILLTVANSRGTFSRQLEIAPLTGEINVP